MIKTIDLDERLIRKAKKLSGIDDDKALLQMTVKSYIEGEEFARAALKTKKAIGDENPFWDDYDPKA
jgi:hypothetical protein